MVKVVVVCRGVGGRDVPHWPGCVQNVFMQQDTFGVLGSERVSGSRRPLQGSLVSEDLSRVHLGPVSVPFGNRYSGREQYGGKSLMTIPQSDHNAAPLPWQTRNRPYCKFKGSRGVLPKLICWGSFISAPDVVHCIRLNVRLQKLARLLRVLILNESFGCRTCSLILFKCRMSYEAH